MEELAKHGVSLPPNMQGLTDEQVEELKLKDEWGEKCTPSGGVKFCKDKIGCRNGQGKHLKKREYLLLERFTLNRLFYFQTNHYCASKLKFELGCLCVRILKYIVFLFYDLHFYRSNASF